MEQDIQETQEYKDLMKNNRMTLVKMYESKGLIGNFEQMTREQLAAEIVRAKNASCEGCADESTCTTPAKQEPPMQLLCCSECGVPLYAGKMLLKRESFRMNTLSIIPVHPKAIKLRTNSRPSCPDCQKVVDLCLS